MTKTYELGHTGTNTPSLETTSTSDNPQETTGGYQLPFEIDYDTSYATLILPPVVESEPSTSPESDNLVSPEMTLTDKLEHTLVQPMRIQRPLGSSAVHILIEEPPEDSAETAPETDLSVFFPASFMTSHPEMLQGPLTDPVVAEDLAWLIRDDAHRRFALEQIGLAYADAGDTEAAEALAKKLKTSDPVIAAEIEADVVLEAERAEVDAATLHRLREKLAQSTEAMLNELDEQYGKQNVIPDLNEQTRLQTIDDALQGTDPRLHETLAGLNDQLAYAGAGDRNAA